MDDATLMQQTMNNIMAVLRSKDGQINCPIAIPSLLYVAGFILSASKREEEPLEVVLAHCISDILFAMDTTEKLTLQHDASRMAELVINRAKGRTP